jgi:tetratricopeptide (TPR) repeat protein
MTIFKNQNLSLIIILLIIGLNATAQFIRGEDYTKNINYTRNYVPVESDAVHKGDMNAKKLEHAAKMKKFNELNDKAFQNFLDSNFSKSAELFTQLLAIDENNFDAYYFRALSKFYLKDYKESLSDYNQCIRLSYLYIENFIPIKIQSDEELNFNQISSQIKRINRINPNFAQMYLSRGMTKLELQDEVGAKLDWLKSKKLKNKKAKKYIKKHVKKVKVN